jgi:hypothetical protein
MLDLLGAPSGTRQHGLIDGGTRLVDTKQQIFTFETLFCGLKLLGSTWESGIHVFSIDQMKTNRPRAQSSYQ